MKPFKFFQKDIISREHNLYDEMIVQLMVYNSRGNRAHIGSSHCFNDNGHQCEIRILQVVGYIDSIRVHYRVFDSFNYTTELHDMEINYRDFNIRIDETI
jgi:hypothetical protein